MMTFGLWDLIISESDCFPPINFIEFGECTIILLFCLFLSPFTLMLDLIASPIELILLILLKR